MASSPSDTDREWDRFVAGNPHGYHEQSTLYATLRRHYGFHCARAIIRDASGDIAGGAQVLYQKTLAGRLGLVLRGPFARDDDPAVLAKVVAEMTRLARRERLSSIRVETFPTQHAARRALSADGYQTSHAWCSEQVSSYADLRLEEEDIFARLQPAARNQIRGAERKGVTVTTGGPRDVDDFHELLNKTADHHIFPVFPKRYFMYLQEVFGPRRAPIFVARHEGKPVSSIMNFVMGNRMYYCWGGMDRSEEQRRLNVGRLLHFEAMRWARAQGLEGYDLTGTNFFKNQLGHGFITWPTAQRRHFGAVRGMHRAIVEGTGTIAPLHRLVEKGAWRLGYMERMPY